MEERGGFSIQFHSSLGRSWGRRPVSRAVEETCRLAGRMWSLGMEGYLELGPWVGKSVELSLEASPGE